MGLEGDDGLALCTINELGGFMWAWVRGGYGLCGFVGFLWGLLDSLGESALWFSAISCDVWS